MGPTWTRLVEYGLEHYPNATHGKIDDINHHYFGYQINEMVTVKTFIEFGESQLRVQV